MLENGQQVILSEYGHTGDIWSLQPEALQHLLTTFYNTGDVDDSLFVYQPMDFNVGLGFPEIAKISVAVLVLLVLLLGWGVWALIRRRLSNPSRQTKG